MEISHLFMPILTEPGGWDMDFCYKHVAPNGAPAVQCWLFSRAAKILGSLGILQRVYLNRSQKESPGQPAPNRRRD